MGNNMRLSVHGALPCYHGFIAKHSCLHVCMHVRVRRLGSHACGLFRKAFLQKYRFACKHAAILLQCLKAADRSTACTHRRTYRRTLRACACTHRRAMCAHHRTHCQTLHTCPPTHRRAMCACARMHRQTLS